LEFEDILHYQKIIVALSETDKLVVGRKKNPAKIVLSDQNVLDIVHGVIINIFVK
jgi:hypothetical protein